MLSKIKITILVPALTLNLMVAAHALNVSDDFNSGSLESTLWEATSGQVRGSGEHGFLSGHGLWFGNSGSRYAETKDFNTLYGGTISFNMRTGNDGHPLWEASESSEYVGLEYSINEGTTWRGIRYYQGWNSAFASWNSFSHEIPAVARSLKTRFRFRQTRHNGVSWDHWAIDNVNLTTVDGGTSWSQELASGVTITKGRVDGSDTYHAVVHATGNFQLGNQSGTAGTYLTKTTGDGSWSPLAASVGGGGDMAKDSSGNIYLAGGGTVAKYDNAHTLLWQKSVHYGSISGITIDNSGNVTVAGSFDVLVRFGPNGHVDEPELRTDENGCTFIARYDASGNFQWVRRVGDGMENDPERAWGISGDGGGDFYVYGRYNNLLSVNPLSDIGTIPGGLNPQLGFIIKYNSTGAAQWMTNLGFTSSVRGIAANSTGVYAACLTQGDKFNPAGTVINQVGGYDVAILCLDPTDGSIEWHSTSGSAGDDFLNPRECITLDGIGNPYLGHTYDGDAIVAGQTVIQHPRYNMMLSRWTSDGTLTWAKRAGRAGISSISSDSIGQTFISGTTGDLAAFESEAVLSDGNTGYLHKFNNILEATSPVGVFVLREDIPSNTHSADNLGELIAKDSDASGTYTYAFATGPGDDHNHYFAIGGANNDQLILSANAILVQGDSLSLRMSVTDENGDGAESIIPFTVGPPDAGLWAKSFTGNNATLRFCKVGPNNETYIGGYFVGDITFGSWTVTSAGSTDAFLAKLDADGVPQWIIRGGGTDLDRGWDLDIDDNGNTYLCGTVVGGFTFSKNDNTSNILSSSAAPGGGWDDGYLLSVAPNGTLRWLRLFGGEGQEWPTAVKHDNNTGLTYLTGYYNAYGSGFTSEFGGRGNGVNSFYHGTVTGPSRTTSSIQSDGFILCYNPINGQQWVSFATGQNAIQAQAVTTDSTGNVYVGGTFIASASIGGVNKFTADANAQSPSSDAFFWKLSSAGVTTWVKTGGASHAPDDVIDMGIDSSDQITLAIKSSGSAPETADFGNVSLPHSSTYQHPRIVVTYNSDGTALSGHTFGSYYSDINGFKVYPNGSIMLSGYFEEMDGAVLVGAPRLLQLSSTGTVLWSDTHPPAWKYAGFGPDLAPKLAGVFSVSVEIAGQVLDSGNRYIAKVTGPAPIVASPSAITLGTPAASFSSFSLMTSSAISAFGDPLAVEATPDAVIAENEPVGTVVAAISATDTDSSSFIYQLFGGTGDDGNPLFAISGNNLVTNAVLNYEEGSEYNIRLRVVDDTGQTHEQSFLIGITDLPDTISAPVTLSELIHVYDGQTHGASGSTTPDGLKISFTYAGSGTEPSAAGPYAVVATVDHPEYTGTENGMLWIRTPIQDWLKAYYSDTILNDPAKESTIWGNLADPDGDQILNIFEDYHHSNPTISDSLTASIIAGSINPQNKYTFRWKRSKSSTSGEPVYQWSMDMDTWYNSGTGPSGDIRTFAIAIEADNGSDEDVAATINRGAEKTLFMRLKFP